MLTANDRSVLENVEIACREFDGYAPHGAADWTAIRRLLSAGLIASAGDGVCLTCPERHDALLYVFTDAGRMVAAAASGGSWPGAPTGCKVLKRGADGSNANAGKAGPLCFACVNFTDGVRAHCPRCGACLPRDAQKVAAARTTTFPKATP